MVMNIILSRLPVRRNRSTRREPTTFGRALIESFHISPERESNTEVEGDCAIEVSI